MISVCVEKDVPYAQKQVVDIIKDVDAYASFLPWLSASTTHSHKENNFIGTLTVHYKGMQHTYQSKVIVEDNGDETSVKALALDGPFESMMTDWRVLKTSDESSKIILTIKMKWSNKIFKMMFAPLVENISKEMISAFEQRLIQQYPL